MIKFGTIWICYLFFSYHHFSYRCAALWVCNMTQIYMKCLPITWDWTAFGLLPYHQPSSQLIFYINTSVIANAFVGVIIPIFFVALLNIYLIRLLQIRTQQVLFVKFHSNAINIFLTISPLPLPTQTNEIMQGNRQNSC